MDLEFLDKIEEGTTLEISAEDEAQEDVAAVDGTVDVKEEYPHKDGLEYSVIHVDNMGIIQLNAHDQPVLLEVTHQLKVLIKGVTSHRHVVDHVVHVVDLEETGEEMVEGELVFRVSRWFMMKKDTNIRSMMMVTSSLISIQKTMPPPRNKMNKTRETRRNQHRSCLWVCGSILSIEC